VCCARSNTDVKRCRTTALRLQPAAGFPGLGNPQFGEIGDPSSGEEVLQVPFALAVAHEHEKSIAHFLDFPL